MREGVGTFVVPQPSIVSEVGSAASSFPPVVTWSGHSVG